MGNDGRFSTVEFVGCFTAICAIILLVFIVWALINVNNY